MTNIVHCIKLNIEAEALDFAPLPGPLGQKILANVSKPAWKDWLNQQTMIINENRLNLADEAARQYLKQQLEYYFFGDQH
jgi:Fe-S cluster biosynthesis and repair protein YggX